MEEVAALIVELLKTHNRVSLPGMGAFMANPQPAVIDKDKKTILPPSKRITFSKAETWNDGLLEQLYAERHGLSVGEACDRLRHIITEIRYELDANGKVMLQGLGLLRQTQARDISFGLNKNLNLKADSYGLNEVRLDSGASAFKVGSSAGTPTMTVAAPSGSSSLLILLGIMVFAISVVALVLFLRYRGSNDEYMFPSAEQIELSSKPTPAPTGEQKQATAPTQQEYTVHKPQPAPPKPQPAPSASRCEFCIIATSLSTYESADFKAASYRKSGYKSKVISGSNSRYHVTLGCYRTYDMAKQEQRKVQQDIKDAWIREVCK